MAEKTFKSIFKSEFEEILKMKHDLGYKYISQEEYLLMLDNYLHSLNLDKRNLKKEIYENWCRKRESETQGNRRMRVTAMRELARCLNRKGISAYAMDGIKIRRPPKYDAYIYTDEELFKFFKAADNYKGHLKTRESMKYCPLFFRILYTSGLRPSELINLKIEDYNFDESYIIIHKGKNNKDRIVPVHPILTRRCIEMIENDSFHALSSEDDYLFKINDISPYYRKFIYYMFRQYLKNAGIRHLGKDKGPRVYDFRYPNFYKIPTFNKNEAYF